METSVPIPLDSDGFLRRECPSCLRQFKWHSGPASEEAEHAPSPSAYFCPYCGVSASLDSWWTQEQLDYARAYAAPEIMDAAVEELRRALKQPRGSFIQIDVPDADVPDRPAPMTELDDMEVIVAPCHSYEPVKVADAQEGPFHCLVCGAPFAV